MAVPLLAAFRRASFLRWYNGRVAARQWRWAARGAETRRPTKGKDGSMLARDIMTTHIISIEPDASVRDAARLLSTYHISGAPVVDADGVLVGLVTEADLISKPGR